MSIIPSTSEHANTEPDPKRQIPEPESKQNILNFKALSKDKDKEVERLRLMFEVAGRVASTLDLKRLLPTIMQDATRVMNAEASALMLIDEERGELVFEVALGEKGEQVRMLRLKRHRGIAGWVFKHGKTLLVPDVEADPRHAKEISQTVGFTVKSILCSPLRNPDKTLGVVEVINYLGAGGPSFSEEDIPFFEAFADQAATAISRAQAYQDLADLFDSTLQAFTATLDARDPYTQGHSRRVTEFALAIAMEIGLSEEERQDLRLSALLHDVGKIGVPDAVLLKTGKLTAEEFEVMKRHPMIGYNIVKPIKQLTKSLDGIRYHHERLDGGGYPDGLKGNEIPLQGRIIAVADCFDAMTSARSYRVQLTMSEVLQEMRDSKRTQHEPDLVDAFFIAYEKGTIVEQGRRPQATPSEA